METTSTKGLPPVRAAAAVSMGITLLIDHQARIRKKEMVKDAILKAAVMSPDMMPPDVK